MAFWFVGLQLSTGADHLGFMEGIHVEAAVDGLCVG